MPNVYNITDASGTPTITGPLDEGKSERMKTPSFLPWHGKTFKSKSSGQRYLIEPLYALRWLPDYKVREKVLTGGRFVRVDNDGDRIPRARQMEPGVTGKQWRRREKAERMAQRAAA